MDDETKALLPAMMEARDRFMELVNELRPELHRYCARMIGSAIDGEDVVQEALAHGLPVVAPRQCAEGALAFWSARSRPKGLMH